MEAKREGSFKGEDTKLNVRSPRPCQRHLGWYWRAAPRAVQYRRHPPWTVQPLNLPRQRESKELNNTTLTPSQQLSVGNKSHCQEKGHMFLNRSGQTHRCCPVKGAVRSRDSWCTSCCASCPSCAPRGVKEHVSPQGHFPELQVEFWRDLWRWFCPTPLSKHNQAAEGSPVQAVSPSTSFPRPFHTAFDFLKGWRSASPQLSLPSSAVTHAPDLVTRRYLSSNKTIGCIISYIAWAKNIAKIGSINSKPRRKLLQLQKTLTASSPCCTARTDWRAMKWFLGPQDWKSTAGTCMLIVRHTGTGPQISQTHHTTQTVSVVHPMWNSFSSLQETTLK